MNIKLNFLSVLAILIDSQKRMKLEQNRKWFQCTFDYKPSNQW